MKRLRVLLVEDSPDDAALVALQLRRGDLDIDIERVETREAMTAALQRGGWDIVISDYVLPQFSGLEALELVRRRTVDLPFIVVSGMIGEETAVEAMRAGAHDYVMKDNLARLPAAVRRELRESDVRRARREAEARVQHMAQHDPLTDLPNRTLLRDRCERAIALAHRGEKLVGLLFVDLDRFKVVNDASGHAFGDLVLQEVAHRLRGRVRESDTLARVGGDEFVVLVPDAPDARGVASLAEDLIHGLSSSPLSIEAREVYVTASVGIALYPWDAGDPDTLLENADAAMYRAKEMGGRRYQFFTPGLNAQIAKRMRIETGLRQALANDGLRLEYQPQADLLTGAVLGVEALLRWPDAADTASPDEFIAVAEESGLILQIDEWVLGTACQHARAWLRDGPELARVAVNVSALHLREQRLVQTVERVLAETGLPADRLELEFTERVVMKDVEEAISTLRALRALGVHLAIDDFGTGYSSLSYLRRLPIERVKIDQSFVHDLALAHDAKQVVLAIIRLAHSLERRVIAEGVETAEQLAFLREHGCDEIQGFLLGRPVPPEALAPALAEIAQGPTASHGRS